MATLVTTEKKTYRGGVLDGTQVVGYISSKNCVVRFTFTTDSGGGQVSWYLDNNYFAGGTTPGLRWYIGTDPSSHVNAGASTTEYHGDVVVESKSGAYTFSGSAHVSLQPNTTYYLWIFPSVSVYGYYNLTEAQKARVTPSGSIGVVYIDNGTTVEACEVYIDNGTSWDRCVPQIDTGTGWAAGG